MWRSKKPEPAPPVEDHDGIRTLLFTGKLEQKREETWSGRGLFRLSVDSSERYSIERSLDLDILVPEEVFQAVARGAEITVAVNIPVKERDATAG